MAKVKSHWTLLILTAFIGSILYCSLTYVAILHYPGFFDPFTNYLSRLGNTTLNPTGAIYYNLAVIFAGAMLFLTYLGLFSAYRNTDYQQLLIVTTASGMLNSFSLMMSGVFSEDIYILHFIFGLLIFATWIPVLLSMNYILFKRGSHERRISFYGFALGTLNTIFVLFVLIVGTSFGAILEWMAVFSFQSWALLVALIVIWRHRSQPN
jgi:hypothetical membrane protein